MSTRGRESEPGTAMDDHSDMTITAVGYVRSEIVDRSQAPKQGDEGAPEAWLIFDPSFVEGLKDLHVGQEVLVLTWLHRSDRSVLAVHPRSDPQRPLTGVFSTRSPDRPNPIGIHRVRITESRPPTEFKVASLEALDRTPIVDVKPVLDRGLER